MDQFSNSENKEPVGYGARARQLLQVWRDYYDEIFEVDLATGSFESMMDQEGGYWTRNGFANIEVILLAEKLVHPDDKENFKEFFDLDRIRQHMEEGIFVTKINFRMRRADSDDYFWIKVKNIIPTKRTGDGVRFFACFRRVDRETDDDLRYKQQLSDALDAARTLAQNKSNIINQTFKEIKSPLNGVVGMIGLALAEAKDDKLRERLRKIEEETKRMNRNLDLLLEANSAADSEVPEVGRFEDHPVNRISYSRPKEDMGETTADRKESIPEHFAFVSDPEEAPSPAPVDHDFKDKRFLVVEDNELNAEVMKELIESTGARADIAGDGKQAVVKFVSMPAGTYDVILMDIDIPVIDGYSATKCIRIAGKSDSRTVPVIAVTSNGFDEDVIKSYEYGFNAFFTKPVNFAMLFERVEEEFNSRRG